MDGTLITTLRESIPGVSLDEAPTVDLHPTVYVSAADLPGFAAALRQHPALAFDLLAELTAVDFAPREPRFELVYIFVSTTHRRRLRVKVRLPGEGAHVATVSSVWPSANWLEREVWDLFGIAFDGHPDPRRLLMPEDWEGHPLRKDYPVQITLKVRTTEPLQVSEEQFRENLERDRLVRR
jgi:NADH-quinone oxidoreductase subunit C